ncbi:SDR family oxidoreductase [Myxococcus sp. CA033]|uniref:SDR family NAD(P)-dependent oxidoreductase n=1 Tax=Myxococcus sp. CA033 TaxID=2741516 RepID=UPI00157B23A0|nr:SDR family oxidoreductase [Myxococcus sp. CA033]NTX33652.1 SDR family oxidoreductase [Myxococcus sp. CA033]
MAKKLAGKVALVTGGSRGIGAATARALAQEGADVAISYVASAEKAQALVRELESQGVRAAAFQSDQGVPAEAAKLVQTVTQRFGRLDILVNNAGVATPGAVDSPESDAVAFERQQNINVHGVIAAIREAVKVMGQGGRIITVGSSITGRVGMAGMADYTATKAAVVGYTKGVARDLGPKGITVNVVQPGFTATDMSSGLEPMKPAINAAIALGRFGRPEEIADSIVFLAGPGATYITGTVLNVDGGHGA